MATEASMNPAASKGAAGVHEDDLPILQSLAQLQDLQNQVHHTCLLDDFSYTQMNRTQFWHLGFDLCIH